MCVYIRERESGWCGSRCCRTLECVREERTCVLRACVRACVGTIVRECVYVLVQGGDRVWKCVCDIFEDVKNVHNVSLSVTELHI